MLILRKYELQNLRDRNNTCLDADFGTPEVQNLRDRNNTCLDADFGTPELQKLRDRNNTCEKYELQILISSLDAFKF